MTLIKEEITISKNRKASFEYFFLDEYSAGIQLTGTEIKSVRLNQVSIAEAYCVFDKNFLVVRNMNIEHYKEGTYYNHEPRRDRKLLLNFNELKKLSGKLKDKGLTIIPIRLYINEKGLAKLQITLAKGKKNYDKRESIKQKDVKRQLDRNY
jgi:SsrA-binding protein